MKARCQYCQKTSIFKETERGRFECASCKKVLRRCKAEGCENMIRVGPYCSRCVSKGLKTGVAQVGVVVLALGTLAIKVARKKVGAG